MIWSSFSCCKKDLQEARGQWIQQALLPQHSLIQLQFVLATPSIHLTHQCIKNFEIRQFSEVANLIELCNSASQRFTVNVVLKRILRPTGTLKSSFTLQDFYSFFCCRPIGERPITINEMYHEIVKTARRTRHLQRPRTKGH